MRTSSGGIVGWLIFAALVVALIVWNPVGRRKPDGHPPAAPSDALIVESVDAGASPLEDAPAAPSDVAVAAIDAAVAVASDAATAPLYTITEALDDIAASPLEFIGTGAWFGNFSIDACAYRNTHVLVVYEYCTFREQPALGLQVISTRGHIEVYAEADKAISTLVRSGYMTFRIEGHPPTEPPPRLDFTYDELDAWHERRHHAYAGACAVTAGDASCANALADRLDAWAPSAKSFFDEPPPRWYALVKDLRARSVRDLRTKK